MRALGALVAVILMSSVPAGADNVVDNKKQADALFLAGREELAKGNHAAACAKFFDAQKLETNNVAILLNLGLCNEKQGKNATALRWYRKTQTVASEKNDPALKEYEDTAKAQTLALANQVAHVNFDLGTLQPDALLFIDNETIDKQELTSREVDKGTHVIEARLPGKKTSRDELIVEDNTKNLTFKFKALEDAPLVGNRRRRRLKGALIGGSVIVVASAATGLWAFTIKKDFDDEPDRSAVKKDFQDKMKVPSVVFAGSLAVGLGVAAYFFFTAPPGERQEEALPRTAFTPTVSNDGFGFAAFRRF